MARGSAECEQIVQSDISKGVQEQARDEMKGEFGAHPPTV